MAHPSRGAGLALLLSLAAHGLLALVLSCVAGPAPAPPDTFVEDPLHDLSLSMADPPAARDPAPPASGQEEQHPREADFPVVLGEAPAAPPVTDVAPPAPVVVGLPVGRRHRGATGDGPDGEPAAARPALLQAPPAARSVVYVLDRSLSMGLNGALARARRETLAGLARLPEGACFQVILYNRQAEPLRVGGRSGLLPADGPTREAVARELDRVAAAGNTDHARALRQGLLLRPDVLFLVTDADDLSDRDVLEVTRLNAGRTAIHAVELTRGRDDADGPLRRLAALNGGTCRRVPPGE